eukprot:6960936-Pyramimonas_sp.AAC.1
MGRNRCGASYVLGISDEALQLHWIALYREHEEPGHIPNDYCAIFIFLQKCIDLEKDRTRYSASSISVATPANTSSGKAFRCSRGRTSGNFRA